MDINKIKWIDAYESGGFRVERVYLLLNNKPANKYTYGFNKKLVDLENLDVKKIQEQYPNAHIQYKSVFSEQTNSAIEDEELELESDEVDAYQYIKGNYHSSRVVIYDNTVIYDIEPEGIEILYQTEDPKVLLEELLKVLPFKEITPKSAEVQLVCWNDGYYTITSKIKPTIIDLNKNYNDDFMPVYNDICKFLEDRVSGLIILRGVKGSGKTSLIRHLISSIPKNYIIVTNAIAEDLASPTFMSFMLEHKDSIFILEDCEQILLKRTEGNIFGGAITNILNMSDGLMSDIFNIKFICTFNADINKIDDALLRKGRCYAHYEFKKLDAKKTQVLLNERNITLDKYEPMTLADIYNYGDADYEKDASKTKKKIGFC